MSFLIAVFLFILGLAVGSFLNVLIYRTVKGESWLMGRSYCDHCQKKIVWYDNIPLFSYLWLRGKSRCCGRKIPLSYPLVEVMTGSLFVWWYAAGSLFFKLTQAPFQTLQPLFWLAVGTLLLVIFFSDLLHMIIPDLVVGALLLLTIFYRLYLVVSGIMQWQDFWLMLGGMVLGLAVIGGLWLVTKGKGMGFGDVKFVVPMAWLLGWPKIMVGLFLAFFIGGVIALVLLILGQKKLEQKIAFGPFLVMATVLSLLWGDAIFSWYWPW